MKKAKRRARGRRKTVARKHRTVGQVMKLVSEMFQIPRQAIILVGRNRRKMSTKAKLAQLREAWHLAPGRK